MEHYRIFVIIPFDKAFKVVYTDGISPAVTRVNETQGFTVEAVQANFQLKGLDFVSHVHEHVRSSDICITDITGANANVMYELGYARAIGKKTIIIRQSRQSIPVDITDKYIQDYEIDKLALLTQFLHSAIVKAVEEVVMKRRSTRDFFPVTCYQNRMVSDIGETMKHARERIDVLTTNVVTLLTQYCGEIKSALDSQPGLRVRILTLDPDSSFVNNRADQLGIPVGQYRRELHESIQDLQKELSPYGDRFILRMYNDFPTQIAFLIDDMIFACSISRGNRSRNLCTFKLHVYDTGAERTFRFHFDSVWSYGQVYVPF